MKPTETNTDNMNRMGEAKIHKDKKFKAEMKSLRLKFPGEAEKFIFGSEDVDVDYVKELIDISKNHKRISDEEISELKEKYLC